ncbi:glycine-rich domain-containing protein [Gemmobacter denitrificans]|uniref:Uncharacterized protein n=1 Tax=Gemmobacter denitrificans TaxID=3123040 RepID=A0ABU8BSH4_9RHOB
MAKETELTVERASAAVQAYRQFLWLCATQGQIMAPSAAVDAVWHLHLMDTRAYATFCDQVIGRMIHHIPDRPPVAEDPAYAATRAALTQHFGPPSPNLWPDPVVAQAAERVRDVFVCLLLVSVAIAWTVLSAGWGKLSVGWVLVILLSGGTGVLVGIVGLAYFGRKVGWPVKRSDGGCGGGFAGGDDGGCGGD